MSDGNDNRIRKQAGAELCQAQDKFSLVELNFNFIWTKKVWAKKKPKICGPQKNIGPKIFLAKKNRGLKKVWAKIKFGLKKLCGAKKFCARKKFEPKKSVVHKKFCPKKSLVQKKFGPKKKVCNGFLVCFFFFKSLAKNA